MAGVEHNAFEVAARFRAMGPNARAAALREFSVWVQKVVRTMRSKAPKFQSELTNSVHAESRGELEALVAPGVSYSLARETGTRPGGLPRFNDPAAAPILAWLQSKAFAGQRSPRRGSAAFTARELELRDRYQGLAWHVRRHGTQATPYVRPTAEEVAGPFALAMAQAITGALRGSGGAA